MSGENEKKPSGFSGWLKGARNGVEDILAAVGIGLGAKHLLDAFRGKPVPADSKSALAKSIGGHRKPDDEKWHERARRLMKPDKLLLWDEFIISTETLYGSGVFSRNSLKHFLSDLRVMLAAMMVDEQNLPVKKTEFKNGKGVVTRVVTENDPKFTPLAVWVMEESADLFGAEKASLIQLGATEEAAQATARDKLLKFFLSRGLPTPSFVNELRAIDDFIVSIPNKLRSLKEKLPLVGEGFKSAANIVGSWIDQKHDELEERNNREGWYAGFRRWYRSLR